MLPKEDRIRLSAMLNLTLPGIFYQRKQNKLKRSDSDQVSRYNILSKETRIKRSMLIFLLKVCTKS